jgi:hypothetical protein
MTAASFAFAYRRTAENYRRRAAEVRSKATPKGRALADKIAGRWEAMAKAMDDVADSMEAANRTDSPHT